MVTVGILNGVAHLADPDKENETFCGESYTHESADHIASGARYADDFLAEVATNHNAEICEECRGEALDQ